MTIQVTNFVQTSQLHRKL